MSQTAVAQIISIAFLSAFAFEASADTGSAVLDRPRAYDLATQSFLTDLSLQDSIDGGAPLDEAKAVTVAPPEVPVGYQTMGSAAATYQGIYYSAIVREAGGADVNHIFLVRNRGLVFEGWDHDSKTWTTNLANMDPIDSDPSLGQPGTNPALAIDSQGNVYIAYTRTVARRYVFLSKYDVAQNDVFIWRDSLNEFTNDLAAGVVLRDSIGPSNFSAGHSADNVAPAIAIDENDDVYVAYSNEMSNLADAGIFLSKFDATAQDALIYRASLGAMTTDIHGTVFELDSISLNMANFESSTTPVMAIDGNGMVYIAYVQQGLAGGRNRVWLSRYNPATDSAEIWDDGVAQWNPNNFLSASPPPPCDELDSIGNNYTNSNNAVGIPAMGIDSQNNVYIAYVQSAEPTGITDPIPTLPKLWLSKYDAALNDAFIWHDGLGAWTNNLALPDDELDSFGVNALPDSQVVGNPALVIDDADNVWVAYTQEASDNNPKVFLSKYDAVQDDVFVWDDATSTLTNDQTAPQANSAISWNNDADQDVVGSPSMALAANGDLYIAYAVAASGSTTPHVSVSYFDVDAEDAFVWDDGAGAWTNDLSAPTSASDSLDPHSGDDRPSFAPTISATSSGIYVSYLHEPDITSRPHAYVSRIGYPQPNLSISATDSIVEGGPDAITFEVRAEHAPPVELVVAVELSGVAALDTDYTVAGLSLSGSTGTLTLPAGAGTATFTVTPIDDAQDEGMGEDVIATLLDDPSYDLGLEASAARMIIDDERATYGVLRGGLAIENGATDEFVPDMLVAGESYVLSYSLYNAGSTELLLTGEPLVTVTPGSNVSSLSLDSEPNSTIPVAQATTLTVTFVATESGEFDFQIGINTNSFDTPTFTWTVAGQADMMESEGGGCGCTSGGDSGTPILWLFFVAIWHFRPRRRVASSS